MLLKIRYSAVLGGVAMELFSTLFGKLLVLVYHCFDRLVINGYLSGLSRPEQVVYFFRQVVGKPVVDKELLRQRTTDYQNWVEAYARNHAIDQWAEKDAQEKRFAAVVTPVGALPALRRLLHLKAWRGRTFRSSVPGFPPQTPTIASWPGKEAASPTTSYSDEVLAHECAWDRSSLQATYYLSPSLHRAGTQPQKIGFRKNDNAFLAVDSPAQLQAAADRLSPSASGWTTGP
jgi:hypothetical protein